MGGGSGRWYTLQIIAGGHDATGPYWLAWDSGCGDKEERVENLFRLFLFYPLWWLNSTVRVFV